MKIYQKLVLILGVSILANQALAGNIEKDKFYHFGVSAALGMGAKMLVEEDGLPWKSFGLAVLPGLAKEIYDDKHKNGSGFSKSDLLADALGAALGVSIGNTIITFQKEKKGVQIAMMHSF